MPLTLCLTARPDSLKASRSTHEITEGAITAIRQISKISEDPSPHATTRQQSASAIGVEDMDRDEHQDHSMASALCD
ncbi:MAG: hypothetical protein J3Q66DRAFT_403759 [Benniella sp.]|nr:MAG: hypothetical protein J3Q66DRAFT_403759 [Benniella sp.]